MKYVLKYKLNFIFTVLFFFAFHYIPRAVVGFKRVIKSCWNWSELFAYLFNDMLQMRVQLSIVQMDQEWW